MKKRQFSRKRAQRPICNRAYLEVVEEMFIVGDLRELDGSGTPSDLIRHKPMRYNPRYLNSAMKRLARRDGPLRAGGRRRQFGSSRGTEYHLRKTETDTKEQAA